MAHRHLVLRERAGLVRADDRRAPERLDDRQAPHERLPLHHPADSDRERDRDDSGQRLGDDGDGERDAEHEHLDHRQSASEADDHDQRDDRHRRLAERGAQAIEIDLERRAAALDRLDQARDVAKLRRHAGGDDEPLAAPVHGHRAGVRHVASIAQRQRRRADGVGDLLRPARIHR